MTDSAMEGEGMARGAHILVIPYPVQGHISPMLQFSKRLASKGLQVTLVTTIAISKSMQILPSKVNIELISDGYDKGEKVSLEDHLESFKIVVSQNLANLIKKQNTSKNPVKFLVYDSIMPWALDIAQELGLGGAPFFTHSSAVAAIYYHAGHGTLKLPLEGPVISMPSMPMLEVTDFPSFVSDVSSYPNLLKLSLNRFSNFEKARWLLFNTFDQLEEEVVDSLSKISPLLTIGPTVPSFYLDNRVQNDSDYDLSLFNLEPDSCIHWLHTKPKNSVVYVAFGSLAALGKEKMEELAWGLKRSNFYFLWVVRKSEEAKLPENFIVETIEKGLVVNWSPQLKVLSSPAVGCFFTHCGWNSTMEALSFGVPMVAMPQWTDQPTNAKFIADVWKVGVRAKVDKESGIVGREEVERCIREVMEGESGEEMKRNAEKWKDLTKEAVSEGGSSDKHINEFVSKILGS
ncbi:UDP-glycosyltransferase 74F2-like [Malania oleifera]|uniref:UDP-glycosyltransferase 74F2-like n=1 Tax=Malania oleifera TaxID=397392 RepID=UPI0025AE95AB|nr:UDP-glycosyltransferase 74F2-like [Malania oleifera]